MGAGGVGKILARTDPLSEAWEHFHQANVHLANAHHTSRNVPQTGDLAQAIKHAAEAERLVVRRAVLTPEQRLMIYGPAQEVNDETVQSKAVYPQGSTL